MKLDDEVVDVQQWDAVRVDAETMRNLEAGPDGVEFLAIGGPNGQQNDAESVKGWG